MGKEKQYRYNDIGERYQKMNRAYIIAASCLWSMFLIYLVLKAQTNRIALPTVYGNIVVVAICFIISIVLYIKDRRSISLKKMVAVGVGIEVLLLGVQTDAEFLYFALLGILALQIPYYDKKIFRKFCLGYTIQFTVIVAVRVVKRLAMNDVDSVCRIICVYLMLYVIYQVGSIAQLFSDHALGAVEEQNRKQGAMLEGILDISRIVQEESEKSGSLVDELVGVTKTVAESMQEISSASNMTASSIEEQNNMTQNIQEAIEDTGERSKKMVEIAMDSNESIQDNLKVMEEMKGQSEKIASTNSEVTEAMERLQNKTKEVEDITGMILNISSQTNLLALNASIESARAGEAGKGFAVVADQIRQLAEQTKKSTEAITKIINELNENAAAVVASVGVSVHETENQNKNILSAADAFEKLDENMAQLIQDIHEIDRKISGLSDSNNHIVENISHLSAATQQVTASAEQVREMSSQNLDYAEEVKGAIVKIQEKTDGMKEYL